MAKEIKYKENTYFIGRNGCFKQSGIDITEGSNIILLHPITSKGLIGRATITIPKTQIEEFVKALLLTPHK
jgi:hypothetical protein